jgi:hypothetical protein
MVRPTSASLNSLAKVVREAQPLYAECRSIINYLDAGEGICPCPCPKAQQTSQIRLRPMKTRTRYTVGA